MSDTNERDTLEPRAAMRLQRRFLALLLAGLVVSVSAASDRAEKAQDKPKWTILFFTASWCGPCKPVHKILEKHAENSRNQIRLVCVDYDAAAEEVARWKVESIPVVIVLDRGGKVVLRAEGASDDTLRSLEEGIARLQDRSKQKE